jgi:opacity protein-like surface antigen
MKRFLAIAVVLMLAACSGVAAPTENPLEGLVFIPTEVPNACANAWAAMGAEQKAGWRKSDFNRACAKAGYLYRCTDGYIDIDPKGFGCSNHGAIAERMKWVDA